MVQDTQCCSRAALQVPTALTSPGPLKARPPGMCQMPSAGAALVTPSCCSSLEVGQAHREFLREQNCFLHGPCSRKGFVPCCLIPCSYPGCLQPVIPATGRVQEPKQGKCLPGSGSSPAQPSPGWLHGHLCALQELPRSLSENGSQQG